ncbi:MAG: hypothetical protein MK142_06805 [Pseudomonadales bacterium]|nr:hypothetical protein [Pseudomonadales bacterium]
MLAAPEARMLVWEFIMITALIASSMLCAALTAPAARALCTAFPEVPPEFLERQLLI